MFTRSSQWWRKMMIATLVFLGMSENATLRKLCLIVSLMNVKLRISISKESELNMTKTSVIMKSYDVHLHGRQLYCWIACNAEVVSSRLYVSINKMPKVELRNDFVCCRWEETITRRIISLERRIESVISDSWERRQSWSIDSLRALIKSICTQQMNKQNILLAFHR